MNAPAFRSGALPVLYQSETTECGLACLAMIASYYGHHLDLNDARHRFHISSKGTSLKHVVQFARAIGLAARALRVEPDHLGQIQCPAILHIDMTHFVVLKEMRGRDAIVHDPAVGPRRLGADQIERRFTGVVLELAPTATFERRKAGAKLRLGSLAEGIGVDPGVWPKALILSIALQLLILAAPFYVQLVIDRGIVQGDAGALAPLAAGFAMLVGLRVAGALVRQRVLLALGGFLNARLTARVAHHMLRLPNRWFASRQISGLLSRINSTQPIRDLVAEGLIAALVDGAMAILTIAVAAMFAPALAFVVLAGFGCSALLKWWQVRQSMPREHEYIETHAKAQQELIETVRAIATVKLFRKEADREARWGDRHVQSVNARYGLDRIRTSADIGREAIQAVTLILVVYLGALQVIAGTTTLGLLMAFITYQQMFASSASALLDFVGRFRLLDVHLQRLADVMLEAPEEDADAPVLGGRLHGLGGAVAARHLTFRYAAMEEPVLTDLSFEVARGEFVAITGPSGGGKTTLLNLLVGLLEPSDGQVLYDGVPLRTLGVGAVRDQIGVVMQDDILLSGSLAQNITFFDSSPDLEWMRECARMAAIDEDIARFPMAYHTMVGDMGT
ncbi:MAG TPA: peptidase domain-containing ABC transporter, partial [Allosphingosinicella sp.]|nr:peptidase domain-containing ABC transporter [Allosphingosinicella sp.]